MAGQGGRFSATKSQFVMKPLRFNLVGDNIPLKEFNQEWCDQTCAFRCTAGRP